MRFIVQAFYAHSKRVGGLRGEVGFLWNLIRSEKVGPKKCSERLSLKLGQKDVMTHLTLVCWLVIHMIKIYSA